MITLEQAKAGRQDYVDQQIIDTFRRSSLLLEKLVFDDAMAPNAGSTLKYTYMRQETPAIASFREINKEYEPQESTRKEYSVEIKSLGVPIRLTGYLRTLPHMFLKSLGSQKKKSKQPVTFSIRLSLTVTARQIPSHLTGLIKP